MPSSGIPASWAAREEKPGLIILESLSDPILMEIRKKVTEKKQAGDLLIASVHWGGNWGYGIPYEQKEIARRLIEEAGFDLIHGHSSHHFKGIEIHKGKPIFYGCGDLINDYEGIRGQEAFRSELPLLYFVEINPQTGNLLCLHLIPLEIRKFRLNYAVNEKAKWVFQTMKRECNILGTILQKDEGRAFSVCLS